jgi:hypothetical protein
MEGNVGAAATRYHEPRCVSHTRDIEGQNHLRKHLSCVGFRISRQRERTQLRGIPWVGVIVIVGCRFIERLRRNGRPTPQALTLAYFFPLPNVCFIFFPLLDFKAFRETYQPDAALATAQKGVKWIVRGLSHILAYRIVKYYVLPHLVLFLAANYAVRPKYSARIKTPRRYGLHARQQHEFRTTFGASDED